MQTKCVQEQPCFDKPAVRRHRAAGIGLTLGSRIPMLIALLILWAATGRAQDPSQPVGYSPYTSGLVLWDQCGWQGAAPCNSSNPIYNAADSSSFFFLSSLGCDLTLVPLPNQGSTVCTDTGNRATSGVPGNYVPGWLAFQESDQFDRISADLPINLVPMLGTHNSYSNPHDGGTDVINLDQSFTITDQLNLGARFVRLDPVVNSAGSSVMGCHTSSFDATGNNAEALVGLEAITGNTYPSSTSQLCATILSGLTFAQSLNGRISLQRPIYLAVEEIRYWLQQNPTEVVVITVNNFYSSSDSAYIVPSDLSAIFQHVLGTMMLTPGQFAASSGGLSWPTLRQIRSLGKQALVLFATTGGDPYVWGDTPSGTRATTWNDTASSNFLNCEDYNGNPVGIGRDTSIRQDIGEDRSLSNAFTVANICSICTTATIPGQMTWTNAAIATACGFSTISLDFIYSLNQAVDDYYVGIGTVNYTTGGGFFNPQVDERPMWTIWSWPHNLGPTPTPEPAALVYQSALSAPDLGAAAVLSGYPATTTWMNYRWVQMDPSTSLPVACAGPDSSGVFPDPNNMWLYQWAVTPGSTTWSNGEAQCQQDFGPAYHFWRPMSSPEDRNLTNLMSVKGINQVWLNHFPATTVAQPSSVTLNHAYGAAQTPTDIIVTSGFGQPLQANFAGNPNFLTISQAIPGSNIFQITVNDQAMAFSKTGTYTGTLTIFESQPTGFPTTSNVSITLNYYQDTLIATPATVNFVSSLTQTVQITSQPSGIGFTYNPTLVPGWLTVNLSGNTAPATMTLTADPATAPQQANYNLILTPQGLGAAPATISVSIDTVQVQVDSIPSTIPLLIDQALAVSPVTKAWVIGSQHQLVAPVSPSGPGIINEFQNWTGPAGGNSASITVNAPTQPATFVAHYNTYYALTLLPSPSNGGTLSASPAPSSNGDYLSGAQVTITATPSAGYVFKQFTGGLSSQQSPGLLTMNGATTVTGVFVPVQALTSFNTVPAGLSILVDGVSYPTPASFAWATTEQHTVAAPTPQAGSVAGVQYVFNNWNDTVLPVSPRNFGGSSTAVTYTLDFSPQYQVSVAVNPSSAGTVSGTGWFAANAKTTLQATAAAGFAFSSFSGGVTSSSNPVQLTVLGPFQVTANFTATQAPLLFASSAACVDLGNGNVQVPIVLTDLPGTGPAGNAMLTGVTVTSVPTGASLPVVQTTIPAGGFALGTLFPGQSSSQTVLTVAWPTSATRATFAIKYSANGGTYTGTNSITIFR
jgi:hypothetical protein